MVYIVVCKITNKSLSFLSDLRPKENNNKHHQGNAFIFDNKSKIYIYIYTCMSKLYVRIFVLS
jgi:hypothetical protein